MMEEEERGERGGERQKNLNKRGKFIDRKIK
jgi:hypothetical protein